VSKFKKRHPALKHGGYSSTAVLPGENPAEFEELYQALMVELAPRGALEEDIVADIARLVWRKQNLETFRRAESVRASCFGLRQRKFDEKLAPDTPDSPWSMLSDSQRAKIDYSSDSLLDKLRKEPATVESLSRDLEIEERLGALIDRCLKRLLFLRGLKSLPTASSSAAPQPVAEPQRIPGPTKAA
jgi:hypothetical protein